jgi:hypothetical protein
VEEAKMAVNAAPDDFVWRFRQGDWNYYFLTKKCILFNKVFEGAEKSLEKRPVDIYVHRDIELSKYVSKINEHIDWLSGDGKEALREYVNKNMETAADDRWFDDLEISDVIIRIGKDGRLVSETSCSHYYEPADDVVDGTIEATEDREMFFEYDCGEMV